jgi:hypothetical protein
VEIRKANERLVVADHRNVLSDSPAQLLIAIVRTPRDLLATLRAPVNLLLHEPVVDAHTRATSFHSAIVHISVSEGGDSGQAVSIFAPAIEVCFVVAAKLAITREAFCLASVQHAALGKTKKHTTDASGDIVECVSIPRLERRDASTYLFCGSITKPAAYGIAAQKLSLPLPAPLPPPPPPTTPVSGFGAEEFLLDLAVGIVVLALIVAVLLLIPRFLRYTGISSAVSSISSSWIGARRSTSGRDEESGLGVSTDGLHRRPDHVRRSQTRTLHETDEDLPFLDVAHTGVAESLDTGATATPRRRDVAASGPK